MSSARAAPCCRSVVLSALLVCVTGASPAFGQATWGSLTLPGGATAAREATGLGHPDRPAVSFLVDVARAAHTQLVADRDPVAALLEYLNDTTREARRTGSLADSDAGELVRPEDTVVPLPLPDLWRRVIFDDADFSLADLIADPEALLLYLGLVSLDRETLDWLATEPDVFEELYEKRAGTFAAFGRSLHVRDSAVAVPGGTGETALWEELVGARVTEAASFVRRVLSRDHGRLAYFYDTAMHLDPAARAFLMGHQLAGPARRSERLRFVRRAYEQFVKFAPTWRADERPFFRPVVDPALVLNVVAVEADGTVGPSWWTAVLDRAATSCSWNREREAQRRPPAAADANWLLTWIFEKTGAPDVRFAMLRLVQRRFTGQPEETAPHVEIALCGRQHLPALALVVDRLGIDDPALYAELTLAARRLTGAGDSGLPTLRSWQASLSLIEQAARHGGLRDMDLGELLASLARAAPERPSEPHGAVIGWVLSELLPTAGLDPAGDDIEASALRALAGVGRNSGLEFAWEGLPYRLDVPAAAARSAMTVRDVSMGPRLDDLRRLHQAAQRFGGPSATAPELHEAIAALGAVSSTMVDTMGQPIASHLADAIASAMRSLERVRGREVVPSPQLRRQLLAVVDELSGDILPALAYALAMSPVAGPPEIYAEAYRFHDFGVDLTAGRFEAFAWSVPRVVTRERGGSQVAGALVGLDLARAADRLRRVSTDGLADSPVITEADFKSATARLALAAGQTDWETAGASVAAAIARGRGVVAEWVRELPPDEIIEELLEEAAVGEWRISLARWLVSRRDVRAINDFFTMTDYYRLGTAEPLPEGWGQSGWLIEACWCLRAPVRRPPEDWLGRTASLAASVSSDLPLRLTELLAELHLPHALLEPLLPMALQDVIDHTRQISTADWEAFAWARHLPSSRVEEYMLALLADGMLAAPRDPSPRVH